MTKSKLTLKLVPLTILILLASGLMLFIVSIVIKNNLSNLTDLDILAGILFLTWIAVLPLVMMLIVTKNYVTHPDKIEVNYFFGQIKRFYAYTNLKISDYVWTTKGLLIELPNGDQMTLGKNQYRNFDEIRSGVAEKIRKEKRLSHQAGQTNLTSDCNI